MLTAEEASAARLRPLVEAGDRRALAQAITLAESTRPEHRQAAETLLEALLPSTGKAIRIGISGAPGVGKSSLIETLGLSLIARGGRVAVLAVDPSSRRTGGSILGDKTRMAELSRAEASFIRPSPTAGSLGGVARRTREAMLLAEAAGFDRIIIETVGVGQSETAVADMVDLFCLLLQPGAGDELQGLKRGIVELAELIVVTKLDGETRSAASRAVAEYTSAIGYLAPLTPLWPTEVLGISSSTGEGIDVLIETIERHHATLAGAGVLAERRAGQLLAAFEQELSGALHDLLLGSAAVGAALPEIRRSLVRGEFTPAAAVQRVLDAYRRG